MAAKSLKCGECGKLLESVKAAQEHSDATSHTSFEETTEVIKVVVCTECGKPCRTDAERGLHTKFTGHTEYKDRGEDEVKPMDTEAQMAAAKADLMDTDDGGGGGGGGGGGAAPPSTSPDVGGGGASVGSGGLTSYPDAEPGACCAYPCS
mmetsp:Transcript_36316/g.107224  ORF Transcript_36316/g.107224 Transcript_36316/m.107224 type:complete len:150 (-) Transcript_36316:238-687(-)